MEVYIKYKRIEEKLSPIQLQGVFNQIIADGFEIIYYKETKAETNDVHGNEQLTVVMVVGKRQNNAL